MNKSLEQREYVHKVIYDSEGKFRSPTLYDDLHKQSSNLIYILRSNPDWPDDLKEDIESYAYTAIDLLMQIESGQM